MFSVDPAMLFGLDLVIKSVAFALLVLPVIFLVKKQSFVWRIQLLRAGLVTLALLPVFNLLLPKLPLPLMPVKTAVTISLPSAGPVHRSPDRLLPGRFQPVHPVPAPAPEPSGLAAWIQLPAAGHWLTSVWLAGIFLCLLRMASGYWRIVRLSRTSRPAMPDLIERLTGQPELAAYLSKPVGIRLGSPVTIPLVWGFRRPGLLLPSAFVDWPSGLQRSVLIHELAHITRGDLSIRLLGHLVCAMYWFNPLSWWMYRLLLADQERACDAAVLCAGTPASSYAAWLLDLSRPSPVRLMRGAPAAGFARQSGLYLRIRALLNHYPEPKELSMKMKIFVSACLLLPAVLLAAVQPYAANVQAAPEPRASTAPAAGPGPSGNLLAGIQPEAAITPSSPDRPEPEAALAQSQEEQSAPADSKKNPALTMKAWNMKKAEADLFTRQLVELVEKHPPAANSLNLWLMYGNSGLQDPQAAAIRQAALTWGQTLGKPVDIQFIEENRLVRITVTQFPWVDRQTMKQQMMKMEKPLEDFMAGIEKAGVTVQARLLLLANDRFAKVCIDYRSK